MIFELKDGGGVDMKWRSEGILGLSKIEGGEVT
jgi:hypothetical protein